MANQQIGRVYPVIAIVFCSTLLLFFLSECTNIISATYNFSSYVTKDVACNKMNLAENTPPTLKTTSMSPTIQTTTSDVSSTYQPTNTFHIPTTTSIVNKLSSNDITEVETDSQLLRQQRLREFCKLEYHQMTSKDSYVSLSNIFYSDKQGVIYCSVPKVACTNWKRIMLVFEGKAENPLDITKKEDVHKLVLPSFAGLKLENTIWRKNLYYSFLFVRHPFKRLLSAYRNKFLDPYNPIYQRRYGSEILRLYRKGLTKKQYYEGRNVTFQEFLDYIIRKYEKSGAIDLNEHWQISHNLCSPCTMKYNFIGKMETLLRDANEVLKEIGVNKDIKFPSNETDKYQLKTDVLMKEFYTKLKPETIGKLYKIYENEFKAFGYDLPDYLTD